MFDVIAIGITLAIAVVTAALIAACRRLEVRK